MQCSRQFLRLEWCSKNVVVSCSERINSSTNNSQLFFCNPLKNVIYVYDLSRSHFHASGVVAREQSCMAKSPLFFELLRSGPPIFRLAPCFREPAPNSLVASDSNPWGCIPPVS